MKIKFNTIAANKNGTRIFCKLSIDGQNVLKGFYDFNTEKFYIIKYLYDNFPTNITKNKIKKILKNILLIDYDWEM